MAVTPTYIVYSSCFTKYLFETSSFANQINNVCTLSACLKTQSKFKRGQLGSDCGTVDITIASDTRGPGFKSSHQQISF